MNSIFGIGPLELFFIAILALVILGPERLPGVIREGAKYFRMLRNMSGELTSQFSEELKALDDINPQKIMNEVMEDLDLEAEKKALGELNPKKITDDIKSGFNPKKSTSAKKTEAAAATTAVAAKATAEAAAETTTIDGADGPVEPVVAKPLAESDSSAEGDGTIGDDTVGDDTVGDGPVDEPDEGAVGSAAESEAPAAEAPAKEPIDILARSQPKMTSNPYVKSSVSRQKALDPNPEPDMSGDDEPTVENRIAPDELVANIEDAETSSEPKPSVSAASANGTSLDSARDIPQDISPDTPQDNTGDRA